MRLGKKTIIFILELMLLFGNAPFLNANLLYAYENEEIQTVDTGEKQIEDEKDEENDQGSLSQPSDSEETQNEQNVSVTNEDEENDQSSDSKDNLDKEIEQEESDETGSIENGCIGMEFTLTESSMLLKTILEELNIEGEISSIATDDNTSITISETEDDYLIIVDDIFSEGSLYLNIEDKQYEIKLTYKSPVSEPTRKALQTASKQELSFIGEIKVFGRGNKSGTDLKAMAEKEGYTFIEKDLNAGAGGDYIYLCYKKTTDFDKAIKDIVVMEGHYYANRSEITYDGKTYRQCSVGGDNDFVWNCGDLNHLAGGRYLYFFYTTELRQDENKAISSVYFNDTLEGSVSGTDLNKGCDIESETIYLHRIKTDSAGTTMDMADEVFIRDIALVENGKKDKAKARLEDDGYILLNNDLNEWAGGDYIYLGYKTTKIFEDSIKDMRVLTGKGNARSSITLNGRDYLICPVLENDDFRNCKGDLNHKAGGDYIFLFYTRQKRNENDQVGVSSMRIRSWAEGSVDGVNLNKGTGGDTLYLHISKTEHTVVTYAKDYHPQYIKDIKLVGQDNNDGAIDRLRSEGYTVINYDLNHMASGQYIYLGYKITENYNEAIKDITFIKGNNPAHTINQNNRTYTLCSYTGDGGFDGNLNKGAGGKNIYLYYTRDDDEGERMALRTLSVDNVKDGAVGGQDLNESANGDYIYLHATHLNYLGMSRIDEINPADWMRYIPDSIKITTMNLPGAHDAGSVHTTAVAPVSFFTRCQDYHIGTTTWTDYSIVRANRQVSEPGLLQRGVRYFDIRYGLKESNLVEANTDPITYASDHLRLVHGTFSLQYKTEDGYSGIGSYETTTNDRLMQWISEFFKEHPYETVILDLGTDDGDNNAAAERWAYQFFFEQAKNPNPKYPEVYVGNHVPALGECRGKIVLLCDFNGNNYWWYKEDRFISIDNETYYYTERLGDISFINERGNLNHNAGGDSIYLLYTKSGSEAVTEITTDNISNSAINNMNLNSGIKNVEQIYLHQKKTADINKKYIAEIKLSAGKDKESIKKKLTDKGYTLIDYDLNKGTKGDYIYLGYKTTTDFNEAIKDLYVMNGRGLKWDYFTIEEGANAGKDWAFKNVYCVGDEKKKNYAKAISNSSKKYALYKNNKYDGAMLYTSAIKWVWIENGLRDAESYWKNENLNYGNDTFMLLYTSANNITTGDLSGSPAQFAAELNDSVEDYINNNRDRYYGIVAMDFVDSTLTSKNVSRAIWSSNFYREFDDDFVNSNSNSGVTNAYRMHDECTIRFDGNGGTGVMQDQFLSIMESDPVLDRNLFVRDGWTFAGWSTSPDGNVEFSDADAIWPTVDPEYDKACMMYDETKAVLLLEEKESLVTLYAVWYKNNDEFNVIIDERIISEATVISNYMQQTMIVRTPSGIAAIPKNSKINIDESMIESNTLSASIDTDVLVRYLMVAYPDLSSPVYLFLVIREESGKNDIVSLEEKQAMIENVPYCYQKDNIYLFEAHLELHTSSESKEIKLSDTFNLSLMLADTFFEGIPNGYERSFCVLHCLKNNSGNIAGVEKPPVSIIGHRMDIAVFSLSPFAIVYKDQENSSVTGYRIPVTGIE